MTNESAYVSTREAAEMLGISLRTAQLWVESGVLLAWKTTGGHRRILLSSVEKVLAEKNKVQAPQETSSKRKLVIVEDDADLLLLMEMTIRGFALDCEIYTATDGFQGLMLIGRVKPDVVIADLNMPDMDGFKMIASIEGGELTPATLIITTALSPQDITARGGVPERSHILEKPFSFTELEKLLRT